MDDEKQLGGIEHEVPFEDTRPVSDPDEILQLLHELLERTEAMEARLGRITSRMQGLYRLADDDDMVEERRVSA